MGCAAARLGDRSSVRCRRLPSASTLANWVEATSPGFVFAVKANMRITHIMRLKNAEAATELFLKMIDPLRSARRLGPILFQLPPAMKCDVPLMMPVKLRGDPISGRRARAPRNGTPACNSPRAIASPRRSG